MRDPERGIRLTLDVLITALAMIGAAAWWAAEVRYTLPTEASLCPIARTATPATAARAEVR